jgi:acetyltransferase-like isoleucine patch superfamily enzyme
VSRDPSVFVHERALCESDEVGARTRIWPFAHVMRGARVGEDCNIGEAVFIESGARVGDRVTVKNGVQIFDLVTVEDDAFLGPNATFTNDLVPRAVPHRRDRSGFLPTRVRRGATVGANATVVCGVSIGEHAFVGAGAVVVRDVPAFALVTGNPARRSGWICLCGERLPASLACGCGRRFRLEDPDAGLALAGG